MDRLSEMPQYKIAPVSRLLTLFFWACSTASSRTPTAELTSPRWEYIVTRADTWFGDKHNGSWREWNVYSLPCQLNYSPRLVYKPSLWLSAELYKRWKHFLQDKITQAGFRMLPPYEHTPYPKGGFIISFQLVNEELLSRKVSNNHYYYHHYYHYDNTVVKLFARWPQHKRITKE